MMNSAERRRLELLEREKDPDMDLVHMERLAEHHAQEFMTQLTKLEREHARVRAPPSPTP